MSDTFGPYELRSELDRGAAGVLWQAWDPVLERDVLIKELLLPKGTDSATAAEYAATFMREGQAAARLSHPGIVRVYAAEIHGDRLALVMESVEGETLGQRLSRGPIDAPVVVRILQQLLEALAYAHSEGVIHGGIEPHSIFLTPAGQARLAGFGIPYAGDDPGLTRVVVAMGAPGYMSPEQINRQSVDARADFFALGAAAYEMLTGKNPFGASDGLPAGGVMYRTIFQAAPEIPRTAVAGLPRDIRPVLVQALAMAPGERFSDAGAFLAALDRTDYPVADTVTSGAHSRVGALGPRMLRSKRKWLLYAGLAAVVLVAALVVLVVTLGGTASTGPQSTLAVTTGAGATTTAMTATTTTSVPATTTTAIATTTTVVSTTTTMIATTTTTTLTRYQERDPNLAYVGPWVTSAATEASDGSFVHSNTAGASVTVTFNGSYLAWIAKISPVYGVAQVTLDNKSPVTVDLYSASALWQQKVWETGPLAPGAHTVKIEWTGTKNAAATDRNISVDAFDVAGVLAQASALTP